MFLQELPNGVNKKKDLKAGTYRCLCSVYQCPDLGSKAMFMEFALEGSSQVSAVDLLVIDPSGQQMFSDFMLLPNGTWRDSDGVVAQSVGELFPPEIIDFRLLEKAELDEQTVGGAL